VDTETCERGYFRGALREHTLHFFDSIEEVPPDAELLSFFINSRIGSGFLASHPGLRLAATRSTTLDHIDLDECAQHRVTVCRVPAYGDSTVAEHTFALMLAVVRRLREAMAFDPESFSYEALRGVELRGRTLGVVGAGRIGLRVLELARGFRMHRIAYDPEPWPKAAERLGFTYVSFDELLHRSDVISLHATLTPESFHMFSSGTFAQCKRGVVIINTANGALIDTEALIAAMDAGIVAAVGLDVLEDERILRARCLHIVSGEIVEQMHDPCRAAEPRAIAGERIQNLTSLIHADALLGRPDVVFTPHIGFNSVEAIERINRITVRNIEAFLQGQPANVVTPGPAPRREKALMPDVNALVPQAPCVRRRYPKPAGERPRARVEAA